MMLRQKIATCLDFTHTEKFFADGLLLFVAELRRMIKHLAGSAQITAIPPKNDKVSQVMRQVGLYKLLGIVSEVQPKDDDVVHWRYAHGSKVDGEKYEDILASYDGDIASAMQERLFAGVTEAMTNVVNHAYDIKRNDGFDISDSKEWWMFSQEKDGFLSVSLCDLGAGIPGTLQFKQPSVWKRILSIGKTSDADTIDYAIRDSISRTRRNHRGNGLGQIVRVVQSTPGAQIAIFSNHGTLIRSGGRKRSIEHKDSILGTLISWRIPLQRGEASK